MKNKILIVDDEEINSGILSIMLQEEFDILIASDGIEALEIIEREKDTLAGVLLDIYMPRLDGFGVMKEMKARDYIPSIPVIVISAESSNDSEREAFNYGASDFVRKPFDPVIVKQRVTNTVDLFVYKRSLEQQVERQISKLRKQAEELKTSKLKVIDVLGTVVESRNLESGEHIMRVRQYTEILARQCMILYPEYGLTPQKIHVISAASALHDIGKIAISDAILLKPGRLTQEEFEIMKTHTLKGCDMIENIKDAWDEEYGRASYEICRHHHERFDGRGYPDHLVGDAISIEAQLVSLADVYDALINERVYKAAYPKDVAFNMIVNGECGIFSPKMLECFRHARLEMETAGTREVGVGA